MDLNRVPGAGTRASGRSDLTRSPLDATGSAMFSPKMQRPIRINESQLLILAERARYDATIAGFLHKRTSDGSKWQMRWFILYQARQRKKKTQKNVAPFVSCSPRRVSLDVEWIESNFFIPSLSLSFSFPFTRPSFFFPRDVSIAHFQRCA